jgi:subtilase family serine protease
MLPAAQTEFQLDLVGDFAVDATLPPNPCLHSNPIGCFGADTIRAAYGIQPVLNQGITGAGRTIVVIDAFQNPTIQKDLAAFDSFWNIPAPPNFTIVFPYGIPSFNPASPLQIGWSQEISIDVEWAHAIAPGASIVLVEASSEKDVDLVAATKYAIDHNLGDVITQSFGEAEMCAAPAVLAKQHAAFRKASERGITVFASSGDRGAARQSCDGTSLVKSASTPASDPEVTGVGGTHLVANGSGIYQSESAWNSAAGASGGGFSKLYRRPIYQAGLQRTNRTRGVPDVAYNADGSSGFIAVWSPLLPPARIGIGVVHGTSAGTPQWAGIAALADQASGHRLGSMNKRLYQIARSDAYARAFHDIVIGNNSFGGVTGFAAGPGWDPVTGLGTPNVANLITQLRRHSRDEEGRDGEE